MGLFDFFGKKKEPEKKEVPVTDPNLVLLHILQEKLQAQGFQVKRSEQYQAITVLPDLEIATAIITKPDDHPSLMHAVTLTTHPVYFPKGIKEHVVGMGQTMAERAAWAADNYVSTLFQPIIDGINHRHMPEYDFHDEAGILWHMIPGDLVLQGKWPDKPDGQVFIAMMHDLLRKELPDQPFNWLKVYAGRNADGEIFLDCSLNNQTWEKGVPLVEADARMWPQSAIYLGLKQFFFFRRCASNVHQ